MNLLTLEIITILRNVLYEECENTETQKQAIQIIKKAIKILNKENKKRYKIECFYIDELIKEFKNVNQ